MTDHTASFPLSPNGAAAPADPIAAALGPEQQRTVRLSLWVLGVLGTGSLLGVAFSLYLVTHAPLLLIGLSPLGRHLVLAAPAVAPAGFLAVLVARRMAFYTACFQLGGALGPFALPWLEARAARFAGFVRWIERIFSRAPRLVVLFLSGPTVSALAGVSGMKTWTFAGLASVSLVLRGLLVLGFAEWIRVYLEIARAWIDAHWIPGTIVMVAAVGIYQVWRASGSGSDAPRR